MSNNSSQQKRNFMKLLLEYKFLQQITRKYKFRLIFQDYINNLLFS